MTQQQINTYYENLYKRNPKLANAKGEENIRQFVEKYFNIKK